eukprot:7439925-Alexandrium_andersonii.AAC.1
MWPNPIKTSALQIKIPVRAEGTAPGASPGVLPPPRTLPAGASGASGLSEGATTPRAGGASRGGP